MPDAAFRGLTSEEARRRLAEHGPNAPPEAPRSSFLARFVRQFKSPIIYILLFALAFEVARYIFEGREGLPLEILSIGVLLVVNAALGVAQDYRSDAALDRLKAMAAPRAWVVRDGVEAQVPTPELVPGDVIRLEAGDRVHADARLGEGRSLTLDESLLTGESVPVEKSGGDELSGGTLVVRGRAHAVVTRTGAKSAMGRLAGMLGAIETGKTPLEKRLEKLGNVVAAIVIVLALALVGVGWFLEGSSRLPDVLIFAIALAVAVVPEELPAVLALTLALGVERMAKRKALVRRLVAVEALGSVTVIATDKTGTLTENRMRVRVLEAADEPRALRCMVVANDADVASGAGDPTDLALLDAARERGVERGDPDRVSDRPFDSAWKFARVTVREGDALASYVKGAPEVVLARCAPDVRVRALGRAETLAAEGLRVLALAWAPGESEDELRFLGLVGLWDPPRSDAADAVRRAQAAGVRVLMVTGDHPATARAVARAVGIAESDVRARVTPEEKLRIVEELKAQGEVVAMTGDGVNDAPALKRADVGVAMGQRGSDVAREAASLVLLDDNLATIVLAIEEGRSLHANIEKFLRFMFTIHFAFFLLVVGGAVGAYALGLRDATGALVLPLTALQILWINFLADGPPSFALGLDRNPGVMEHPPIAPESPLLDRRSVGLIVVAGLVKAALAAALLLALPRLGYSLLATQTAIFAYEFGAQVLFAYPVRRLAGRPARNRSLDLATLAGVAILLALVAVPPLRELLKLAPLSWGLVVAVVAASVASWGFAELAAVALRERVPQRAASRRPAALSRP